MNPIGDGIAFDDATKRVHSVRQAGAEELSFADLNLQRLPSFDDIPNLAKLDLSDVPVSDITPLGALRNLQELDIARTEVKDLSILRQLREIRSLNISGTDVSDLSPLEGLQKLQQLNISSCENVFSLSFLTKLVSLQSLSLSNTKVSDLRPLSTLANLSSLTMADSGVADLTPLAGLTKLRTLNLNGNADIDDISPLATLVGLRDLSLNITEVSDLSALSDLEQLQFLRLAGTKVSDLSPLSGLKSIEQLEVFGAKLISDLSPLESMTSLRFLGISGSSVSDLLPLAGLVQLVAGAISNPGHGGIFFLGMRLTDKTLIGISEKQNPKRTIETISHLRLQKGLPPLPPELLEINENEEQNAEFDRLIIKSLQQDSFGAQFEVAENHLAIVPSGQETDRTAAANRLTHQLHSQVKLKSNELAHVAARLGNSLGWQRGLADLSTRFENSVEMEAEVIAQEIGIVWAELVSLGSFVEQDENEAEDRFAPDVRRALIDLIETAGVWIRRFPTARKLDDEYASFQRPRVPEARQILTGVQDARLLRRRDTAILDIALKAGENPGFQAGKANSWGIKSLRNIIIASCAVIVSSTVLTSKGFMEEVGKKIAEDSVVAEKSKKLILLKEKELIKFIESLPTHIRVAVKSVIDNLRRP